MLAEGEIEIEIDGKSQRPKIGEEVFIPANAIHRVRNVGSAGNVWYYEYKNLMSHWKNLFPDRIYNISYETLVRHPEKEIRKLLKFCNLTWESNCLNFYKNKRIIKTASDIQARKKVYNTSIDSWKRYNKYCYFTKKWKCFCFISRICRR